MYHREFQEKLEKPVIMVFCLQFSVLQVVPEIFKFENDCVKYANQRTGEGTYDYNYQVYK